MLSSCTMGNLETRDFHTHRRHTQSVLGLYSKSLPKFRQVQFPLKTKATSKFYSGAIKTASLVQDINRPQHTH